MWGLLWVEPVLKEKKKLPALWLDKDLFHFSSARTGMHQPRQHNEVPVAPRAGSLTQCCSPSFLTALPKFALLFALRQTWVFP